MDGLLNINKPRGISSAKALYRVRSRTRVRRSGHAGALDPLAEGVLLIGLGRGTRLTEALMDLPKVYEGTARLDVTNEAGDLEQALEPVVVGSVPDREAVESAAVRLCGEIEQTPPAYSAVKVRGEPAYRRAARGEAVRLRSRRVRIYALRVVEYAWPEVTFRVVCGRGTYVRSLVRDWGAAVGAGGVLTFLRRVAVGPFTVEEAVPLDALSAENWREWVVRLGEAERRIEEFRRAWRPPGEVGRGG